MSVLITWILICFLRYYTTVSSAEQRARYRDDFQALYPEYLELYSSKAETSRYFKEMYAIYNEYKNAEDDARAEVSYRTIY